MKQLKQWGQVTRISRGLALLAICTASMLTSSCSKNENKIESQQLLEVYGVHGSEATARLTVNGKVLFTTGVYIGKNGLGKEGEGDAKTPTGTLRVQSAFGEDMFHTVPEYNYGIATDFNKECIWPKGSAIFIHCKGHKTWTGGCIALDEERMVELLKNCDKSLIITISD